MSVMWVCLIGTVSMLMHTHNKIMADILAYSDDVNRAQAKLIQWQKELHYVATSSITADTSAPLSAMSAIT